jgi:hypothetical protein
LRMKAASGRMARFFIRFLPPIIFDRHLPNKPVSPHPIV